MRYELVEKTGSCVEAVDCRDAALEVLLEKVADQPELADVIEILEIDDHAEVVGWIDVDAELLASVRAR